MSRLVILCAACRVEIVEGPKGGVDTGTCPECGVSEAMEVIEDEVEAALIEDARQAMGRLDGDGRGLPDPRSRGHRFVAKL